MENKENLCFVDAEREGVYDPIVCKPVKDIIYKVFCGERKRIYREHGIERRF